MRVLEVLRLALISHRRSSGRPLFKEQFNASGPGYFFPPNATKEEPL